MPPITEEDVKLAIFSVSPYSAGGTDGLPSVVWQKIWPVLRNQITRLFQYFIDKGKISEQWKVAKSIPLRKADQPTYLLPGAYRPISLLPTLSKALESVIATRIGYLAEEYSLLPGNHFGGLKRNSTVDALLTLQEKIYQPWRDKKILSLMTFDVKGAFNGVAPEVLALRLCQNRISELLVRWIEEFMSNRKASVVVNGIPTEVENITNAGLPQGSPLSPILYLFFNANLVSSVINKNKGSIAFIDDYTAWVTRPNIGANVTKLQNEIIPHMEAWAYSSGATFQAKKTYMVHFTQNKARLKDTDADMPLKIKDQSIYPSSEVKILGVVLDANLRYHSHVARVCKRGTNAVLALKRLKNHLRPETARQLFSSTVAPVIDYASIIWALNSTKSSLSKLDSIQRIAAQAITGAFKTVSLVGSKFIKREPKIPSSRT